MFWKNGWNSEIQNNKEKDQRRDWVNCLAKKNWYLENSDHATDKYPYAIWSRSLNFSAPYDMSFLGSKL